MTLRAILCKDTRVSQLGRGKSGSFEKINNSSRVPKGVGGGAGIHIQTLLTAEAPLCSCLSGLILRAFGSEEMYSVSHSPPLILPSEQGVLAFARCLCCAWGHCLFELVSLSACCSSLHCGVQRISLRRWHGDSAFVWFPGWMQTFLFYNNSNIISKGI